MIQLSNALQNIKSILYNLRNCVKCNILQNSLQELQELLKWNHYFTQKFKNK